ncbi:MAG: hypothetical protein ACD_54C00724G0001, partial [uncultured bacterium]
MQQHRKAERRLPAELLHQIKRAGAVKRAAVQCRAQTVGNLPPNRRKITTGRQAQRKQAIGFARKHRVYLVQNLGIWCCRIAFSPAGQRHLLHASRRKAGAAVRQTGLHQRKKTRRAVGGQIHDTRIHDTRSGTGQNRDNRQGPPGIQLGADPVAQVGGAAHLEIAPGIVRPIHLDGDLEQPRFAPGDISRQAEYRHVILICQRKRRRHGDATGQKQRDRAVQRIWCCCSTDAGQAQHKVARAGLRRS